MARILVIDDEEPMRSLLRRCLERAGHEVVDAPDGAVGTHLFEESQFNLVITDLMMPEADGIETILRLRAKYPQVRILVVSAGSSRGGLAMDKADSLADAVALGADAALAKPFDVEELLEVVEDQLSRS